MVGSRFGPSEVAQDGEALEFAAASLRGDLALVLAAIWQSGRALRFAAPELQAEPDLLRAAGTAMLRQGQATEGGGGKKGGRGRSTSAAPRTSGAS